MVDASPSHLAGSRPPQSHDFPSHLAGSRPAPGHDSPSHLAGSHPPQGHDYPSQWYVLCFRPSEDMIDASPSHPAGSRPPPGHDSEAEEEDMYNKERPRPPKFKTQIKPLNVVEAESAHFECRLVPIGDPDMVVEWYKDGVLLRHGRLLIHTHYAGMRFWFENGGSFGPLKS